MCLNILFVVYHLLNCFHSHFISDLKLAKNKDKTNFIKLTKMEKLIISSSK